MTSVLLFVGGLVSVLVIGVPIVNVAARPDLLRGWLRSGSRAALPVRAPVPVHPFTPLDLGPDPMIWPSERPWPASAIQEPDWPSKRWDDEHFGAFWRNREAVTKPPAGRRRHNPTEVVPAAATEQAWFDAGETKPPQAGVAPTGVSATGASATGVSATAVTPVAAGKRPPAKAARPPGEKPRPARPPAPPPAGPPDKAELEALIAKLGVAGAVRVVMDRTGWDFRAAAQYLAKHR